MPTRKPQFAGNIMASIGLKHHAAEDAYDVMIAAPGDHEPTLIGAYVPAANDSYRLNVPVFRINSDPFCAHGAEETLHQLLLYIRENHATIRLAESE
jgi:hypothetical protein